MSFSDEEEKEKEMYPILMDYFNKRGYKTISEASFKMIKNWRIDVVAYNVKKKELIGVEAKLKLEKALEAISQAEIYQMVCSKVYVAFPQTEWELEENQDMRRDVEEICKKRGIGILKVIGKGLTHPCKEIVKPALALRIDLVERMLQEIKRSFKSFNGFDEDDFSYFLDREDWKKEIIRKKLNYLIKEIEKVIPEKAPFLVANKMGMQNIGKNYAGLNIFKGVKQTECTHFSIGISANSFSVYVQIPTKKLVNSFLEKLRRDKEKFLSIIKDLPNLNLKIYSRTSRAKHRRPMRGGTIYKKILDIRTSDIRQELLDDLTNLIGNIRYPAIDFSMDYPLKEKGYIIRKDDAFEFIFSTLNKLKTVYDFILH